MEQAHLDLNHEKFAVNFRPNRESCVRGTWGRESESILRAGLPSPQRAVRISGTGKLGGGRAEAAKDLVHRQQIRKGPQAGPLFVNR